MDDSLIITGDSLGNVILRQQPDGEKIQDLSIGKSGHFFFWLPWKFFKNKISRVNRGCFNETEKGVL